MCDSIAVMVDGSLDAPEPTKQLFASPRTVAAAVLTGCKNIADARKSGPYEVEVPAWGIRLNTAMPVMDDLCAIGLRAHYFHPRSKENVHPVTFSAELEEPFESTLLFRYEGQKEGTMDIWWRVTKDRKPGQFPERLGIAPQNVLLLYPEQRNQEEQV